MTAKKFDLIKLEKWCQDAVTLLPTPELPQSFVEMRRETIKRHSGTRALHDIAADLAEGLSHLPREERDAVQNLLIHRYGFGYDLYTDAKLKRVRAVLIAGKIRNEDEYRELLDVASDTTISAELRRAIAALLV